VQVRSFPKLNKHRTYLFDTAAAAAKACSGCLRDHGCSVTDREASPAPIRYSVLESTSALLVRRDWRVSLASIRITLLLQTLYIHDDVISSTKSSIDESGILLYRYNTRLCCIKQRSIVICVLYMNSVLMIQYYFAHPRWRTGRTGWYQRHRLYLNWWFFSHVQHSTSNDECIFHFIGQAYVTKPLYGR